MPSRRYALLLLVVLAVLTSCGDDDTTATGAGGPDPVSTDEPAETVETAETDDAAADDGSAGDAAADGTEADDGTRSMPDPTLVATDATSIQELLLDAEPGDVIEIPAGEYAFERSLSLNVDGVTIRGAGMDETVLSFAGQLAGAEGLLVSGSDFTIEDLAIEDTVGDALKINEAENVVIRRVRAEWTGGPSTDNGAYGLYPVQVTNLLIEESVAIGASDAGIYVGQSNNVVVRNNRAEFNVAGIEIENTVVADVYGNTATNNTGGILVFNLPGLNQQGSITRVYDNDVVANNEPNFAQPGTAVSAVPAGSGILVMANDQVEVFENRINDNASANIIVTSSFTIGLGGEDDPSFDGYPEGVHIFDNEMSGSGTAPDAILAALQAILFPEGGDLPDIIWDGSIDEAKLVDGELTAENRICVRQPGSEVVNADAANGFASPAIETETFDCTLDRLQAADLPFAS